MPTTAQDRAKVRAMVRGAYALQKLRIQAGLRLYANFRAILGQEAGMREDELTEEAANVLDGLRESYVRLTDGIAKNRTLPDKTKFKGDQTITDFTELVLVHQYIELEKVERRQFAQFVSVLPDFPIYTQFLLPTIGVGPAMAAVIISEIDITRAEYPSSLWAIAGLDVGPDGRGRSRRKEHLIKRAYVNKEGEDAERDSITFNPFLKTKLCGVLGPSFLRTGSKYAKIYRDYKHRYETDPAKAEWTKAHRHQASIRVMVKIFLLDLYKAWRPLEGLPVSPPYHEAKLGHVHDHRSAPQMPEQPYFPGC